MSVFTLPKRYHPNFRVISKKPIGPVEIDSNCKIGYIDYKGDAPSFVIGGGPLDWTRQDLFSDGLESTKFGSATKIFDTSTSKNFRVDSVLGPKGFVSFQGNLSQVAKTTFTFMSCRYNSGPNTLIWTTNGGTTVNLRVNGNTVTLTPSESITAAGDKSVTFYWDAFSNERGLIVDGVIEDTNSTAFTWAQVDPYQCSIWHDTSLGEPEDGIVSSSFFGEYDSLSDLVGLTKNPYQILKPVLPYNYFTTAATPVGNKWLPLPKRYHPDFRVPAKKPINGVLDPSWRYAKNIAMLALPEGRTVRDLATNRLHTPTSTAFEPIYDVQHGNGIGTPNDDTSEIILGEQYGSGGSLEKWSKPTSEVTLVCVCRRVGTAAGNAPIFGATTATNSPYTPWNFIDRTGNGTLQFESAIGGVYGALELPNALSDNKMHVLVGTYDGTNTRLFVDGVERLSDIRSGALTYPSQCRPVIGNFWDYDAQPRSFNGYVYLGLVLDKAIPREEVGSFSRELYTQFLEPATPYYYPIPGDQPPVNIIEALISFGLSVDEVVSTLLTAQGQVSESVVQGVVNSSQVDFSTNITESLTLDDTEQSKVVIVASVGESINVADVTSASAVMEVDISEGTTVADTLAKNAVLASAISEAISAGYATTTGSIILADITEALNAGDQYSSTISVEAAITEAIQADVLSVSQATLLGAVTEAVQAGEVVSSTLTTDAVITEQTTLSSQVLAGLAIEVGTLESVGLSSSQTCSISIEALVAEGLNVADSLQTEVTIEASVEETAGLSAALVKTALLEAGLQDSVITGVNLIGSIVALELELPKNRKVVVTLENRTTTITAENRTITL